MNKPFARRKVNSRKDVTRGAVGHGNYSMLNNAVQSTPAPAVNLSPDGNTAPTEPAKERDGLSFIHSSLDDAGLAPAEFRVYVA